MLNSLSDMYKAGRIRRVSQGMYTLAAADKPEIRKVMWRLLRMRRAVAIGDLQEMAGASERYAREWLQMLEKKEIVRHEGGIWRLLVDMVDMPEDDAAAEKYRKLREKKKGQAMADLQHAKELMAGAIELLKDI